MTWTAFPGPANRQNETGIPRMISDAHSHNGEVKPQCSRCGGTGSEPDQPPAKEANGSGSAHGKLGKPMCGRRSKQCRKCKRAFSKGEYEIWACPNCGTNRACRQPPPIGAPIGAPCKYHGGMALPAGPLHPSWIHGRYSKVTPPHMTEAYEAAMKDENLLSIREEIALHNAMIVERWGRLQKLEAASKLWADLKSVWAKLEEARAAGDTGAILKLLSRLGKIIRDGSATGQLMEEVSVLCERKSKLTTREFQRLRDMRQMVTQERVTTIIVSLAASVREHVTDATQLRQIAYDFSLLLDDHRTVDEVAEVADET